MSGMLNGVVMAALAGLGVVMARPAMGQFGGWGPPQSVAHSGGSLATGGVGDFDGDGVQDFVFADNARRVLIKWGDGSGTLPIAETIRTLGTGLSVTGSYLEILSADFNGDGIDDLVVPIWDNSVSPPRTGVQVFLGSADRNLTALEPRSTPTASGNPGQGWAVADVNGNGRVDILFIGIVSDSPAVRDIYLVENLGDGIFAEPVSIASFETISALAAADLDGDGRAEIVTQFASGTVVRYDILSDPDATGQWSVVRSLNALGIFSTNGLLLADMTGDGSLDLVSVNTAPNFFVNEGGLNFTRIGTSVAGLTSFGIRVTQLIDVDGDGRPDIVTPIDSFGQRLRTIFNRWGEPDPFGLGPTVATGATDFARFTYVQAMDIDANGTPDLVWFNGSEIPRVIRYALNQTDVVAPGAFDLLAPNDGTAGMPRPEELALWGGAATMQWSRASGFVVRYNLEIATDEAFSQPVFVASDLTERRFVLPAGVLDFGTTYYWQVTATNLAGQTIASNAPWTFRTVNEPMRDCPADFDGDGQLTIFDFLAFQNAFAIGCP